MENQNLIDEILKLLDQSSMGDQERAMWTVMVSTMPIDELQKFKTILTTEVEKLKAIKEKALKEKNAQA